VELLSGRINGDDSLAFLNTFVGKKRDVEEFLMRSLDTLGSIVALLVFSPVIILLSVLIKMSSAGSVFYKQQRMGKDGKTFTLYKFRTMVKDAEKELGPVLARRDDPRVTKVGRILRTTRLDELPQLLNVLRGDMSLVGPRPERPHFVKQHKALHELRLAVKPGLTGLAQIRSVYDLKPKHKIKYDYLYIQKRSLLLNLYILFRTIPAVFARKGW
jgi:lipopolysaccharide/colanic/teichoic acid biosynthesis glycosyltransferase